MEYLIAHGVIITGYDETNNTFGLRERIIIKLDGLYYLQLTEEMLYKMWENSCISMKWEHEIYYIKKNTNFKELETEEILKNIYLSTGKNCLINYVKHYNSEYSESDGFFLRRHYDATVYFFELIQQIITSNELETEIKEFREKYSDFINLFVNNALKNMMSGAIRENKMEKQMETLQELDHRLFSLIGKISKKYQTLKNVAFGCKVTASSMVVADMVYSGDKTVNGKYSDAEMLQNHWVSNDTDKVHWITYDLGQKWPVRKIVLYHIKCNVLVDYTIQGSNDNRHWDDLCNEVNNQKGIAPYYLKGQLYQYLRVYITNPSTQGNAARLLEFQAWS